MAIARPYDAAQTLVHDRTSVGSGSERLPPLTKHVADGLTVWDVAPSREEIQRRSAAVAAGKWRRPVGVLGIAGAYLPTRPASARTRQSRQRGSRGTRPQPASWHGHWRDAKGVRFSLMDAERIVPRLRWHQGQNEAPLGAALDRVKKAGVIPADQGRLGVVCAGASWLGKQGKSLVPHARQVLDSSHGTESRHRVAKAHYGAAVQALEGVEATMTRRDGGKVGWGLGGLRRMQASSDEAEKAMAPCWDSLDAHRERTH